MDTRRRAAFETMAFLFSEAFSIPCTLLLPQACAGRALTGPQIVLKNGALVPGEESDPFVRTVKTPEFRVPTPRHLTIGRLQVTSWAGSRVDTPPGVRCARAT